MFGSMGGWGEGIKRGFFDRVACEQELKEVRVSQHSRLWRKQHKDIGIATGLLHLRNTKPGNGLG